MNKQKNNEKGVVSNDGKSDKQMQLQKFNLIKEPLA